MSCSKKLTSVITKYNLTGVGHNVKFDLCGYPVKLNIVVK